MRASAATSKDLLSGDFRLDGNYHTSEGIKAIQMLKEWAGSSRRLDPLGSLADLYNGPRFPRIYVDDSEKGIAFLSSSDMLLAELSGVKHLSKKRTPASLLQAIKIERGWTLISCSGTIGNTVYVRQDMAHMTGSQHIMRAAPKEERILSGYLYAFISSKIGYLLLTQGTYGAVIQHIEPQHIENLPIPRLKPKQERCIHELIEQAAELRVEAQREIHQLKKVLEQEVLGIPAEYKTQWPYEWSYAINNANLASEDSRLDAFYYVGHAVEYSKYVNSGPLLGQIAEIKRPGRFKRIYIGTDGIPFLSGVDVYQMKVKPRLWISPLSSSVEEIIIRHNATILVQADGQRYGILGRPVFVDEQITGSAVSDHLVRIIPNELIYGGYIYIYLSTDAGRRELIRTSYGTSIPTIPLWSFEKLQVSGIDTTMGNSIGTRALIALGKRTYASQLEDQAQVLLAKFLILE